VEEMTKKPWYWGITTDLASHQRAIKEATNELSILARITHEKVREYKSTKGK